MRKSVLTLCITAISIIGIAQDSIPAKKIKTGWNFGFLPVISFNSDLGLQYGALTNVYQYGDGKVYPGYYHSYYAEISMYTKGSAIYRVFYDSKYLLKGIRTTFDVCYLPDLALDFYGFNGAQAVYNKDWVNDELKDGAYKTRVFYKQERNILRGKFDFQGKTGAKNLNWAAGILLANYDMGTVDIAKLNKGKDEEEMLPDTATLYDNYIEWGIIKEDETKGGFFTSLKAGLVYDSRDNEPNPMKGLWSEVVVSQTINPDFNFTKLAVTHRQYFTLVKNHLSFAYRLGFQGVVAGNAPYYLLPDMVYSYIPSSTTDGLGGSKSVRGMVRNRVVGKGMAFGNLEMRYQFVHFNWINQNFYLALSPFMDFGKVVIEKEVEKDGIPTIVNQAEYFNTGGDILHITYGAGFRIAMNENFIIAADLGFPADKNDGDKGIYIGLNWLF